MATIKGRAPTAEERMAISGAIHNYSPGSTANPAFIKGPSLSKEELAAKRQRFGDRMAARSPEFAARRDSRNERRQQMVDGKAAFEARRAQPWGPQIGMGQPMGPPPGGNPNARQMMGEWQPGSGPPTWMQGRPSGQPKPPPVHPALAGKSGPMDATQQAQQRAMDLYNLKQAEGSRGPTREEAQGLATGAGDTARWLGLSQSDFANKTGITPPGYTPQQTPARGMNMSGWGQQPPKMPTGKGTKQPQQPKTGKGVQKPGAAMY